MSFLFTVSFIERFHCTYKQTLTAGPLAKNARTACIYVGWCKKVSDSNTHHLFG